MLTAARGVGTAPSTASTGAAAAADLAGAGGAGAIGGGGGNFPLAVALLAFAFANFINIISIWCAPPSLPPRSKSNARGLVVGSDAIAPAPLSVGVLGGGWLRLAIGFGFWLAKN